MNLYSPHYDPDENRTIMSIDENGSWVHIKTVQELVKQNEELNQRLQRAIQHGTDEESQKWSAITKCEQLKQKMLTLEQVSGTLCDKCGWAMKFPGEPCRCELQKQVDMLRNALEQMDLQICAAGDLMTKEDMQEADRLTALRDSVLEQTKD